MIMFLIQYCLTLLLMFIEMAQAISMNSVLLVFLILMFGFYELFRLGYTFEITLKNKQQTRDKELQNA